MLVTRVLNHVGGISWNREAKSKTRFLQSPSLRAIFVLFFIFCSGGCASNYKGAVYAHHKQISLVEIAAKPSEGTPLGVTIGYDAGTLALVPKYDAEGGHGDVASLISQSLAEVASIYSGYSADSTALKPKIVIRVSEAIISGAAALAASSPSGTTISTKTGRPVETGVDGKKSVETGPDTVTVHGTPGDRVSAALERYQAGQYRFLSESHENYDEALRKMQFEFRQKSAGEDQKAFIESIVKDSGTLFQQMYNAELDREGYDKNNPEHLLNCFLFVAGDISESKEFIQEQKDSMYVYIASAIRKHL